MFRKIFRDGGCLSGAVGAFLSEGVIHKVARVFCFGISKVGVFSYVFFRSKVGVFGVRTVEILEVLSGRNIFLKIFFPASIGARRIRPKPHKILLPSGFLSRRPLSLMLLFRKIVRRGIGRGLSGALIGLSVGAGEVFRGLREKSPMNFILS